MKPIKETDNEHKWPRQEYKTIDLRKRDLVVRIANWSRDKDEPAYDVEVYIGGVYDWNESESFTKYSYGTLKRAKEQAVNYASSQIAKLL